MLFNRNITRFYLICAALGYCSCGDVSPHMFSGIRYHPNYDQYQEIVSVTEPDAIEHLYTRVIPEKQNYDVTILLILAAVKLLLIKVTVFGIGLMLFLKVPLILMLIFGKFLVAIKAIKIIKLLTLPFNMLAIIPLLGAPLFLLGQLLLPLLLMLPIPVLSTTTTTTPAPAGRRRKRQLTA